MAHGFGSSYTNETAEGRVEQAYRHCGQSVLALLAIIKTGGYAFCNYLSARASTF